MKGLISVLIIFAAAVGLTLAAKDNTGYVLLVAPPYRIELSLNLFALCFFLLFFLVYGLMRLAANTLSLPEKAREYHQRRDKERGLAAMQEGIRAYFEGRFAKAEKSAQNAFDMGESPGINAVISARAAHELRKLDKSAQYLKAGALAAPHDRTLLYMTEIEFCIEERRYSDALTLARELKGKNSRQHTAALRLELKAEQMLGHWDRVLDLVDQLDTRHAFDAALSRELKRHARMEKLKAAAQEGRDAFLDYWQKIPKDEKLDAKTAAFAAHAMMGFKECRLSQETIEASLEENWDSDLLALYGECPESDALSRLERAEKWLQSHDRDAVLLLVLGKLCIHQKLWGKAGNYLDASLSVNPSVAAHLAAARLAERLQHPEEAENHYRRAQEMILNS